MSTFDALHFIEPNRYQVIMHWTSVIEIKKHIWNVMKCKNVQRNNFLYNVKKKKTIGYVYFCLLFPVIFFSICNNVFGCVIYYAMCYAYN